MIILLLSLILFVLILMLPFELVKALLVLTTVLLLMTGLIYVASLGNVGMLISLALAGAFFSVLTGQA